MSWKANVLPLYIVIVGGLTIDAGPDSGKYSGLYLLGPRGPGQVFSA